MKILYVGSERSDAQAIATALRGIDQVVAVSWAARLEHVLTWLNENRDLAALIVESRDRESGPSILTHVGALAWHPPIVVIVPDGTEPAVEPSPVIHYSIHRNQSLFRDLPVVVTRAIERATHVDLQQQLARATAALQDAEQRQQAAVAAANRQMEEIQTQYEFGMARAAATWEMVDEQLRTAALEVERARQQQTEAAADVDRLSRQLTEADAALAAANTRTEHERLAAEGPLAERHRELESKIAHEVDRRRGLEELLEEAVSALDDAEKRRASEMSGATAQSRELEATLRLARQDLESRAADVDRLAAREEEINARLVEVIGSRTDLESRLAATEAAFDEARARATRERLALSQQSAEREAELDGQIRREYATRATLEQVLADRETALRDAQQQHGAALAAAAIELVEHQAQFDRKLTNTSAQRDHLAQRLSDSDAALDQARRDHRAAAADIQRLTEREADLTSQLDEVQAARSTLARQLAEATSAIQRAAAHESELDAQIQQERATRDTLEQTVAEAEAALREAHRQHDAALAAAATDLAERQAHFDRTVTKTAAQRDRLSNQLTDLRASLEQARRDHQSAAADVERLTQREASLTSQLDDVEAARSTLAHHLAEAAKEIQKGSAREAELNERIQHERASLAALEQAVADGETALRNARQQHDAALAAAATDLAEHEARFDRKLTKTVAQRDRLSDQLTDLRASLEQARRDHQSAAADVERLTQREAGLTSQLDDVEAARSTLAHHLAEATKAIRDGSAREAELNERIQHELANLVALEQAVADGRTALRDARQQHEAALVAAATNLAERQAHFDRTVTKTAAQRDRLSEQLTDLQASLEQARRDHQSATADVERLTQREADLTSQLDEATKAIREGAAREAELNERIQHELANLAALEQAVADGRAVLRDAQQQHEAALATAATDLAERQTHFDRTVTKTAAQRDRLSEQLTDLQVSLEQARRDHQSATADVERLTQRGADLTSQLDDVEAARSTLAHHLAKATTAIQEGAARESELNERIQQELANLAALEQAVADGETALRDARQQHEAALAAAATDLAERQAHFDRRLTKTAAQRDRLSEQLTELQASLEQVRRDHQSATADVEHLTQREADLTSQLADVQAALEQAVADGGTALRDAQQRHDTALAAAATELAERQAHFDRVLTHASADRDRLAQQLSEAHVSLEQVTRDHQAAAADVERLSQREADLTSQLTDAEAAHRDTQQQHEAALAAAAADLAQRQTGFDRDLSEIAHDRNRLVQQLRETTGDLEDVCRAYEASTADIEQLTRREAELISQLADAETAARDAQERHDAALAAAATEFAEHQARLDRELLQAAVERDSLQRSLADVQDRVQQLQQMLADGVDAFEASRADSHRLFEHAGLPMFRCTRDGVLIDANRACTTLVGRRTFDELQSARFPAAVFDAPNALFWLIERCLSTRVKETVEATWRRHDGGRLFVRLSARLSASDVIEFVAEDLTRLRILEERLSQSHRMEAVGRLASEIAVTCGTLLSDIDHSGREWLITTGVDDESRQRGERLLDDIRRAASLMQELAACGDEQQARTPLLVDLNTLIRDLEPVLKRVAGGDVEVQLQDNVSPLNVDLGTEQVERLLVNLASYGRERMPSGGRLRIELGKSVVDRRFAAKHPNVRLGLHALITVTEIRRAARTDAPPQPRAPRPGVDFGTLQGLVSECGGHLWMKVQPPGEMVAKIRLPLSIPREQAPPRTRVARVGRERLPARWFQS